MRICFFLGGLTGNGGIGRVTSVLANNLVNQPDLEIFVLSYADTHKPLLYQLDERIRTYMLFPEPLSMKKAVLQNIAGKLRSYLKDNSIDIVLACGSLFFPATVQACKGLATKCICWDHTGPQVTTDHAFQAWSRKYGAKHADINAVLTKRAKEYYDAHFGRADRNRLMYNPIDPVALEKRKPYCADAQKIITVGRLTYQKNMEFLIRVADKVLKANPDWAWDVYGDGELQEKLQAQIDACGIGNQLTLKGKVSDIYDRYGNYSFKVLTSRYEGFPMTLLEASANGLPMVSFDIETGPNEIIDDGVNGFLLPPEDEEAMCKAVETLIRDREKRCAMSRESAKSSARFQVDAICEQWCALFREMC